MEALFYLETLDNCIYCFLRYLFLVTLFHFRTSIALSEWELKTVVEAMYVAFEAPFHGSEKIIL